jgi:hypothetical protein
LQDWLGGYQFLKLLIKYKKMNYNYLKLSKLNLLKLSKWDLINILDANGINQDTLKEKFITYLEISHQRLAHQTYMDWRLKLAGTYNHFYRKETNKIKLFLIRSYYRYQVNKSYKKLNEIERTLFALKND